jgi:hypothetical protein
MEYLHNEMIDCPYCGEAIELQIDSGDVDSAYTEDCQVCCRPIEISVSRGHDDEIILAVRSEDDTY